VFLLQDRQIRLQGAATYLAEDYAESIDIIAEGGVDASTMVTASFSLEYARDAFDAAASGEHIKVLVTGEDVALSRRPGVHRRRSAEGRFGTSCTRR
jgi:threonine dehydrogenase-like Zn-dependent dehydrogenase